MIAHSRKGWKRIVSRFLYFYVTGFEETLEVAKTKNQRVEASQELEIKIQLQTFEHFMVRKTTAVCENCTEKTKETISWTILLHVVILLYLIYHCGALCSSVVMEKK